MLVNYFKDNPARRISGDLDLNIAGLAIDSRQVKTDYVFFASKGSRVDGHAYISQAIQNGAKVIICENLPPTLQVAITYIEVENTSFTMGELAARYFNYPSKRLQVVGITGTNGKTSVATLLHTALQKMGYSVGLISTIVNKIGTEIYPTQHTTPNSLIIQKLMADMLAAGCTHCFMEVSSHAIDQNRHTGIVFRGAVFTNLSHDHLDYHGSFLEYAYVKKRLFDDLPAPAFALVNSDDKRASFMVQNTKAKTYTYAFKRGADFKGRILENTFEGLYLSIDDKSLWVKLLGLFNGYNILAVYSVLKLLQFKTESVLLELSNLEGIRGRFEIVYTAQKQYIIIDYAHTPNALENILKTISEIKSAKQKVVTLVGCGGDRDKTKRPKMAKLAANYSDLCVFTSDNPRTEDPQTIIKDMLKDLQSSKLDKVLTILNRREAIKRGLDFLNQGDILLVAGKGHETYQEINSIRQTFDDREEVLKLLSQNKAN